MKQSVVFFTIFDACYVLNLDRRTDRWTHTQAQLKKAKIQQFLQPGVGVSRVSGVDGNTLDVEALYKAGVLTELGYTRYQQPTEEKLFGMDLTRGAIGCALGHRQIWQKVVAESNKMALILEDDVEFHHRFSRLLASRLEKVPKDWGMIYLGGLDLLSSNKPPRPFVAEGVRRAYEGQRELTAYILHAESAQRCLDLTLPLTWQVDTHLCSQLTEEPAAKDKYISDPMSYVLQPSLVIQLRALGTDVQKVDTENPSLEDASRRMREFIGGGSSIR